jgi:hypothetical protein
MVLDVFVMAGLDPAIQVFPSPTRKQDVDHRDKAGDDGGETLTPR